MVGFFLNNWPVRLVCVVLIVAAYIDGKQLRVPNWLTYSMVFPGLVYSTWAGGWSGLGDGLLGMVVGLACLLAAVCGGRNGRRRREAAGRRRRLARRDDTFYAFCVSTDRGGRDGSRHGPLAQELRQALLPTACDFVGMDDHQESPRAVADRRRTQADDAALAVRHSDLRRLDRLFLLRGNDLSEFPPDARLWPVGQRRGRPGDFV